MFHGPNSEYSCAKARQSSHNDEVSSDRISWRLGTLSSLLKASHNSSSTTIGSAMVSSSDCDLRMRRLEQYRCYWEAARRDSDHWLYLTVGALVLLLHSGWESRCESRCSKVNELQGSSHVQDSNAILSCPFLSEPLMCPTIQNLSCYIDDQTSNSMCHMLPSLRSQHNSHTVWFKIPRRLSWIQSRSCVPQRSACRPSLAATA
jgi:hypothetical protein